VFPQEPKVFQPGVIFHQVHGVEVEQGL